MVRFLLSASAVLLLLSGCNDDIDTVSSNEQPGAFTVMDSSGGNIPYPNDLMFAGSTDGTLNIPVAPGASDAVVKEALNALDGFSTTSPITIGTTAPLESASLAAHVRLFKAQSAALPQTNQIPAVLSITDELEFGVDFAAFASENRIAIMPYRPLEPDTTYVVALTRGIANAEGQPLESDAATLMINGTQPLYDFATQTALVSHPSAQSLEALRQLNQLRNAALMTQEGITCKADTRGVSCPDILISWNFTTQSIGKVAKAFAAHNPDGNLTVVSSGLNTSILSPLFGKADIYVGTLSGLPYYLGTQSSEDPMAPLLRSFEFNASSALPQQRSTQSIPVLLSLPNANSGVSMPAAGWPVAIFQHGITQDRTNLLAIADALAAAGYAGIAIDLPLHGVTDAASPFKTAMERTFDLDLDQDGAIDSSGAYYMNLANLGVARDNVRQSTSDLITLYNALDTLEGGPIDHERVAFLGHSLGTIAAFGFLDTNLTLESVTLAMPGGGIAQLLSHSPAFGQEIRDALAAAGIEPDSAAYESFLLAAQTVLDDADPLNYAASVAPKHTVFALEAVGDGTQGSGDQTIPNNIIPQAPLSGTDPLLHLLGMRDINASAAPFAAVTANTKSRFTVGGHSSLLDPAASFEATMEMQSQTASFIGSQGQFIRIGNSAILAQ
ncbi:MAG: hypothetical protein JXK05_10140 [Campylobacterales bacterium]|nr:hypothetical protein [Campylobacterales bacterium]